jgi:lysyl-tRNA synthetase class 2
MRRAFGDRRRGPSIRRFLVGGEAGPRPTEELQADRDRVRELISSPLSDGDTLDPFAERHDKEYVFSPDRTAALAYRSLFGVALGSGDPIGMKDQFPDCLRRFVAHADELSLRPVVMLARQDRLGIYKHLGFKTLYLGDEAILDVAGFTLDNPRMRNARQAVQRSANFGVTTQVMREADIDPSLIVSLRQIAVLARQGKREEGFSAALEEPFRVPHPDCLVAICHDRTGTLVGFQRYSLCDGGKKLSADAMRRVPGAPNGTNERMIYEVLQWARGNGIVEMSLNFVAFRKLLDNLDVAGGNAVTARTIRRLNPAGAPTLFAFTNKFRPRWVPRYLAYRSLTDIPRFAVATLSAEGRFPPWVARLGDPRDR